MPWCFPILMQFQELYEIGQKWFLYAMNTYLMVYETRRRNADADSVEVLEVPDNENVQDSTSPRILSMVEITFESVEVYVQDDLYLMVYQIFDLPTPTVTSRRCNA